MTLVTLLLRRSWITKPSPVLFALYVAAMSGYGWATVLSGKEWLSPLTILTVIAFAVFSLAHLIETRGGVVGALMAGSAFVVTLVSEAVGVATGFPFGEYAYAPDRLGPKVFDLVPVLIPVAWFMVLYPAYETVRLLLNRFAPSLWRRYRTAGLVHAILAALAMTAWDLSLDPRMVSAGYWAWREGGVYFGIPLSNFGGWVLTSFVIYLIWRLFDQPMPTGHAAEQPPMMRLRAALPVMAYIVTWLGESLASALFWSGPVVGLTVLIAMGVFAAPALVVLVRQEWQPLMAHLQRRRSQSFPHTGRSSPVAKRFSASAGSRRSDEPAG